MSRRSVLLACAAVLLGSGCATGHPAVTADELRGRWGGPDGARITLTADGRFTAEAVAGAWLGVPADHPVSVTGDWSVLPVERGSSGYQVELRFDPSGDALDLPVDLEVESRDGHLSMWSWVGDPDEGDRYTFRQH
jgi:hypothetical protein